MLRYVIYAESTGAIRAVVLGSRENALLNARDGEAVLEHFGYVHPARHRVEAGAIVPAT
jgi:hypothetical protein